VRKEREGESRPKERRAKGNNNITGTNNTKQRQHASTGPCGKGARARDELPASSLAEVDGAFRPGPCRLGSTLGLASLIVARVRCGLSDSERDLLDASERTEDRLLYFRYQRPWINLGTKHPLISSCLSERCQRRPMYEVLRRASRTHTRLEFPSVLFRKLPYLEWGASPVHNPPQQ